MEEVVVAVAVAEEAERRRGDDDGVTLTFSRTLLFLGVVGAETGCFFFFFGDDDDDDNAAAAVLAATTPVADLLFVGFRGLNTTSRSLLLSPPPSPPPCRPSQLPVPPLFLFRNVSDLTFLSNFRLDPAGGFVGGGPIVFKDVLSLSLSLSLFFYSLNR